LRLNEIEDRINSILKIPPLAIFEVENKYSGIEGLTRTAAVLIIIHCKQHVPHILLTNRSSTLKSHTGEMSFPGGQYSPKEDLNLLETALREIKEEIGLRLDQKISGEG
jgi:8-oxo-dGTP pyrophosphatase MutT (NUDIX family)